MDPFLFVLSVMRLLLLTGLDLSSLDLLCSGLLERFGSEVYLLDPLV